MSRRLLKPVVRAIALRVLRVRSYFSPSSVESLTSEPAIVCCNHVSLLDGVIVALASPVPLTFGVDTEFSRRNPISRFGMAGLAWMGFGEVVPVDGSSPFGIRGLAKALERGVSVMIFPEGRISDSGLPQHEQPGLQWLARRSGVRVHRIRIVGAEQSRLFAKAGRHLWPSIRVIF